MASPWPVRVASHWTKVDAGLQLCLEQLNRLDLGVAYLLSRWIGYTADQVPFVDAGIVPDIVLAPRRRGPAGDLVLEAAMALLGAPRLHLAPPSADSGLFRKEFPEAPHANCCRR